MKIIPENIPDQVVNDVIYHDNGVDYAIDSKVICLCLSIKKHSLRA